ncbi:MAG: cyclic pyranopterin monophosphate synthase MoaC [Planctomycetes bacterium]|nr:cyclic pyranopterin monophosphate synthase MoaC [Planctomycetota bacterium]
MSQFSHVDTEGRANMVDVGPKKPQRRRAVARGEIQVSQEVVRLIKENQMKKGDVLTVAQIAGVQAAKQTSQLIPLCHPLLLDRVDVQLSLTADTVVVQSEVRCVGRTGVEMEALTAVSVALLTVYDMAKAVDKKMRIGQIHLLAKEKHDE